MAHAQKNGTVSAVTPASERCYCRIGDNASSMQRQFLGRKRKNEEVVFFSSSEEMLSRTIERCLAKKTQHSGEKPAIDVRW